MSPLRGSENLPAIEVARSALAALKERWWLVLLPLIVAVGGAVAWDQLRADEHTARVLVAFDATANSPTFVSLGVSVPVPPNGAELVSDDVLRRLQKKGRPSLAYLRDHFEVVQHREEGQAELRARAASKKAAVNLANAWATTFVVSRNEQIGAQLRATRAALRRDLARAERTKDRPAVGDLRDRIARASVASRTALPDTKVVASAAPLSDNRLGAADYVLIAAFGLCLGIGLTLLLAWFDGRVRTPAALAAALRTPLVGRVPVGDGTPEEDEARRELEQLRVNLELARGGEFPSGLLVTSVDAQTSAARVAEALASALRDDGRTVVLASWAPKGGPSTAPPLGEDGDTPLSGSWRNVQPSLAGLGSPSDVVILSCGPLNETAEPLLAAQDFDAWLLCGTVGSTRADQAATFGTYVSSLAKAPLGVVACERLPSGGRASRDGRVSRFRRREVGELGHDAEHEPGDHPDPQPGEHEGQEGEKAHSQG
jgi:hypothetical protein